MRPALQTATPGVALPKPTDVADQTITDTRTTPETYLDVTKTQHYVGTPFAIGTPRAYTAAGALPKDGFTLGGTWTTSYEGFTAGPDAGIGLHYSAKNAYVVLGGEGTATVTVDGGGTRSFPVTGSPTLYPLLQQDQLTDGTLQLTLTPGLQAYVFTFG